MVSVEPRVTGQVEIGKMRVTEDMRFTDTVRREDAQVEGPGEQKHVYRPDNLGQDQLDEQDCAPSQ